MAEKKIQGLDSAAVERSRAEHGDNVITSAHKESVWRLFIGKFNDPIIKILMFAAALSLGVGIIDGHYAETIGIFCAIILATGVSFWFEYDAKRRFEVLNVVNDDAPVKVIRGGVVNEVPRRDVVVGDYVVLETGDEVPADGKLQEAVSMQVNESSLTGETVTKKSTDPARLSPDSTYPADMVMRGTTVSEGHGFMIVQAVGDSTEYGKVAKESTVESGEKTPLNIQLERLSAIIGKIGLGLAVSVLVIMLAKGYFSGELSSGDWVVIAKNLLGYFMIAVAIMVMAVPEGLPMSITLSLAMSMRRMLKTNNLVRKMHACETMGAVTVICTDKTGTLTRNRMSVSDMVTYNGFVDEDMFDMIAVNSTAHLKQDGHVIGNPTEGALLLWMQQLGTDYGYFRMNDRLVDQLTFTTERKYMATIVATEDGNLLYVKGAPEIVRQMCADDGLSAEIDSLLRSLQDKAMRTLGFAVKKTNHTDCLEAVKEGGLQFVAVASIADPVREDVPDAVARCLEAGIEVKIITGDTPATAREIARQIGLWDDSIDSEDNIITGPAFGELSDEQLAGRIQDIKIMARARPLDKQRMVKLLQAQGEVVAVTGDGTNDAPALNFAQVGLSMGSGTSVAKQASDITLLDDSFSSIATAVMWGRSLYKNIQRFVLFQLTVNFVAMVVVFFGSIFGGELPLTVTQILWVNIIMDTFAAMALASLPPDPLVMRQKPRSPRDFIINRAMLYRIAGWGTVFVIALLGMLIWWGESADIYHLTIFFTVFVMLHFWNLFNAKAFGTQCHSYDNLRQSKGFLLILLVILIGQIAIVTWGDEVFRTVPLEAEKWLLIIGGTAMVMLTGELGRSLWRCKVG